MSMSLKINRDQGQGQVNKGHLSFKVRMAHVLWPI